MGMDETQWDFVHQVLLCDEPTSGLDSAAASNMVARAPSKKLLGPASELWVCVKLEINCYEFKCMRTVPAKGALASFEHAHTHKPACSKC